MGRGTFVNDPDEDAGKQSDKPKTQESYRPALDPETRDAVRRVRRGIARSLDNLLAFHNRPGLIRLTSGVPGASTLRPNVLEDLTRQAFELVGTSYSNTGDPRGMPGLRRALAERMRARGLDVSEDQILITNGSQQAMMVTAMAALEDKKRVICETPCYTGIPNAFNSLGHWVESIPRDREGPLPDRLDRFRDGRESLLYLVPEMHNPMGTDLSPGRRRLLLDWAASQNGLIIADEIFHDLRIEGRSPVSIFKDAGPERTVMIGSLSKSFASGLRIGWLVSDAERVRSLAALKRSRGPWRPAVDAGGRIGVVSIRRIRRAFGQGEGNIPPTPGRYPGGIRRAHARGCILDGSTRRVQHVGPNCPPDIRVSFCFCWPWRGEYPLFRGLTWISTIVL